MGLLLSGTRGGKSRLAVRLAGATGGPVVVIGTGEPRDDEMPARIRRHRAARPADWPRFEMPVYLVAVRIARRRRPKRPGPADARCGASLAVRMALCSVRRRARPCAERPSR
jgi:hypothetical protein